MTTDDITPDFRRTICCCYCGRPAPVRAAHEDPGYDRARRALDGFLRGACPEVPADLRAKGVTSGLRDQILDGIHLDRYADTLIPDPASTPDHYRPLTTTATPSRQSQMFGPGSGPYR